MFTTALALLFLCKLFLKTNFYALKSIIAVKETFHELVGMLIMIANHKK